MAMLQWSRLGVWGALGAVNGAIAVIAGAFAAHALNDARSIDLLETGARWQAVSALAAILSAGVGSQMASILHNLGALLFALSLYLLAAGAPSMTAMAAPVGGVAMIAGWIWLAVALFRSER